MDYALRLKRERRGPKTWVAAYSNDVMAYIPSLRVLKEGGYEGTLGMWEYGHRAPFTETVEERITGLVDRLVAD